MGRVSLSSLYVNKKVLGALKRGCCYFSTLIFFGIVYILTYVVIVLGRSSTYLGENAKKELSGSAR